METVRPIEMGGMPFPTPIPFSARTSVTLSGQGEIIRSSGEEPILEFFDRDGSMIRKVILDLPPKRVLDHERSAIRDSLRAIQERATNDQMSELYQEMAESMYYPGVKAFWTDVIVDTHGSIWLRYQDSGFGLTADEDRRFRVLSPDGEYLGDTTVPLQNGHVAFGRFMGIRYDEESGLGIPSVFSIHPVVDGLVYPD